MPGRVLRVENLAKSRESYMDESQVMARVVVDGEYEAGRANNERLMRDLEDAIDMFECERPEKEVDWMSDVSIPEFSSITLTQSSLWAAQYFQTRDFVECYLEDDIPDAIQKCAAAKTCINKTLYQRHIYYYLKANRANSFTLLSGVVYLKCWWEQRTRTVQTGTEIVKEETGNDIYGYPLVDMERQTPEFIEKEVPVYGEEILVDRFNFEILDPRNVFTDSKYTYTLQEKDYVILRSEKTYYELLHEKDLMGYENIDELKELLIRPQTTDTSTDLRDDRDQSVHIEHRLFNKIDVIERWGKWPCKVLERDEDGDPIKIESALKDDGDVEEGAEWIETVIAYALLGARRVRLRFQPNPYGFRPIIRGLGYPHPTRDDGIGDGQLARPLQTALDDFVNLSNDRIKFATLPMIAISKYALDEDDELEYAPGAFLRLEKLDDIREFRISDDTVGANERIAMLTAAQQQLRATYPTTMGRLPDVASTSATAVMGAEQRTDTRVNYRSLTAEHTWLTELYWMILKMTSMFAKPETAIKLMGEYVYDFDADQDYYFKPVSQALETSHSKRAKIQQLTQLLSIISNVPNPNVAKVANKIIRMIIELMDRDVANLGDLLDEGMPLGMGADSAGGTPSQLGGMAPEISNQYGMPVDTLEKSVREEMYQ